MVKALAWFCQVRKPDLPVFDMQGVLGHPAHADGDFRDGPVDGPFQPAVFGNGQRAFRRRSLRHAGSERVEPRPDDDQMIGLRPQRVINGSLINGMDKREHKFFTGLNPGTKHDTPAASVDDFKRGDERPERKPDNPRADDYQACDPSTMHL